MIALDYSSKTALQKSGWAKHAYSRVVLDRHIHKIRLTEEDYENFINVIPKPVSLYEDMLPRPPTPTQIYNYTNKNKLNKGICNGV